MDKAKQCRPTPTFVRLTKPTKSERTRAKDGLFYNEHRGNLPRPFLSRWSPRLLRVLPRCTLSDRQSDVSDVRSRRGRHIGRPTMEATPHGKRHFKKLVCDTKHIRFLSYTARLFFLYVHCSLNGKTVRILNDNLAHKASETVGGSILVCLIICGDPNVFIHD